MNPESRPESRMAEFKQGGLGKAAARLAPAGVIPLAIRFETWTGMRPTGASEVK